MPNAQGFPNITCHAARLMGTDETRNLPFAFPPQFNPAAPIPLPHNTAKGPPRRPVGRPQEHGRQGRIEALFAAPIAPADVPP